MKKILCVFGTRPEAVKMAPVVLELRKSPKLRVEVCVTAQHRSMLDDILRTFKIRPKYDLNVMRDNQSLEQLTARVIERLSPILKKEKPDLVLVHGDTTTTFLAALASFYQRIPVGHVEAGLRSHNFSHPFPEEANRRLADALCTYYFAPTDLARRNLLAENLEARNIFVTGNTVIDALRWMTLRKNSYENKELKKFIARSPATPAWRAPANAVVAGESGRIILVTAHRRENFGKPLDQICLALREIAERFEDVSIVYPAHLNPNVQSAVRKHLLRHPRILVLPPVSYPDLCGLIADSHFVITDSGGLQEEAPSLGKPVLVLREVTERPEAVKAGCAKVVGTDRRKVVASASALLTDAKLYKKMSRAVNPYGDGQAARRIREAIEFVLGLKKAGPPSFRP